MSSLAAYGVNDPRISTPDWYAEHNLKWIPTDAIPAVEGGWRLDVGIDSPSGTVRAVRLVPMNKEQTDKHSKKGKKNGFSDKLLDELGAVCSHNLPDTYFFGSVGRTGCRKIHVVNAGNQKNKKSHT